MKIDRMYFDGFEDTVRKDPEIMQLVETDNWDQIIEYFKEHVFNKPTEFYNLDNLRKAAGVDRRLGIREIIEKAVGRIAKFKSKDELIEEEFNKFVNDQKPEDPDTILPIKYFFKAYIGDEGVRKIINSKNFTELYTNPTFSMSDLKKVPKRWIQEVPEYIKDYISLNQFMP